MKTLRLGLILSFVLATTACTVTQVTTTPGYSNNYVTTVGFNSTPYWVYDDGYGYGPDSNWFGGTPNYYNTNVYFSDL